VASFSKYRQDALFLVWGAPSVGPRSSVFARELGITEIHFIHKNIKRGFHTAGLRYSYQALKTLRLLFQKRPRLVFVQSPPSIAALFVYIYCAMTIRPEWLYRFLARKAIATIVTNEEYAQRITSWGARPFILRDIPTTFPKSKPFPLSSSFNVVVVNTFSPDEPLEEILDAAARIRDVRFYITGKKDKASKELLARASENVLFTDFLPDETYYGLLNASDAVACLTTRDNTMQRGACEALSLGKPIITSDWPVLREYFHKGTVHVDNSDEGIRRGVEEIKDRHEEYRAGIRELQTLQRQEWDRKIGELTRLIESRIGA
jgi:glycosyltransferase involved in cell wall biosynthesis